MKIYKLLLDYFDLIMDKKWFEKTFVVTIAALVFGFIFEKVSGHLLEAYFGKNIIYPIAFILAINSIAMHAISVLAVGPLMKYIVYFVKMTIGRYWKSDVKRNIAFDSFIDFLLFILFIANIIYIVLIIFELFYSQIIGVPFFGYDIFLHFAIFILSLSVVFTSVVSTVIPENFSLSEEGVEY